jgi:hypothetical protein
MTKSVPQDMQDVINEVSSTDSGRGELANQYKVLDTIIEDSLKDVTVKVNVTNTTLPITIPEPFDVNLVSGIQLDLCGAAVTIDHPHHEIHEGTYIFADDISGNLGSNDIKYWLLVTPNETNYLHSFPKFVCTGEFELQVYEGATVATNGTEVPMYNRNRATTTPITFKFYKDPTTPVVTNCPIVRNVRTGSGSDAVGEVRSENELILLPNTKYLIKATSRATGNYISCHMNGYICGVGAST